MWHSASSITWEHTPDGRDALQQIFLRRGFPEQAAPAELGPSFQA
jgi:hypothetical protein